MEHEVRVTRLCGTHSLNRVNFGVVLIHLCVFNSVADSMWSKFKENLKSQGIEFNGSLTMDWSKNFQGGLNTNDTSFRHLLDVNILFDLEELLGLRNTDIFVDFQNLNGENGSEEDVGDFQGFSNIDAEGRTQIAELWLEKRLFEDALRIKIGKVDANSEFAYVENGSEFINSSPGFSPTLLNIPTYPDPATSVNVFIYPENFYAGAAVYDGALQEGIPTGSRGPKTFLDEPSDLFVIGEVGLSWYTKDDENFPGRLGLGIWHHSGRFQQFDDRRESGTEGLYLVVDQTITEQKVSNDESREIKFFLQFGYADEDVSELDIHFGGGMSLSGFVPLRNDDALGVMGSYVHFSNEADFVDNYEFALETFYKFRFNDYLVIKPDLQFIVNPGGEGLTDALVALLRIELAF